MGGIAIDYNIYSHYENGAVLRPEDLDYIRAQGLWHFTARWKKVKGKQVFVRELNGLGKLALERERDRRHPVRGFFRNLGRNLIDTLLD